MQNLHIKCHCETNVTLQQLCYSAPIQYCELKGTHCATLYAIFGFNIG